MGVDLNYEVIKKVVLSNNKKRFQISEDGRNIRAVQGHSNKSVNITFQAEKPPKVLYHGTAKRFFNSIKEQGLITKERQYVH